MANFANQVVAITSIDPQGNVLPALSVGLTSSLPAGTNSLGTIANIPSNIDLPVLTLSGSSIGGATGDLVNTNGRGMKWVIDITAITGTTPSLTVTLQGKDIASGKYYNILVSAVFVAVSTTILEIYPGIASTANLTSGTTLPRTYRILYAIAGVTPSVTATVGASIIV